MKFGDQVGRFGVLKKLSQGGMAAVYLGFDPNTNQLVALKVLFRECADEPAFVQRFYREVSILKSIAHRHVVQLVDSGDLDGVPFAALEYCRGTPLSDIMQRDGPMAPERIYPILTAVCRALSHADALKVVHRDIKPSNIIVGTGPDEVKVLDFGVAHADDNLVSTAAGQFLGTVCYAAPEQMRGEAVDGRSDLYAIGVTFYEMLTGRLPFPDTTSTSILRQQVADLYMPPSQFVPAIPPDIDLMVLKLLRADPRLRYATADEFLLDLEQVEARARDKEFHSRSVYDFPEFVKQFKEASAAFSAKETDRALALAEDLVERTPRAAEVFFLLGQIHMERGLVYNGIREFIKATAFDPENTFYHVTLGQAYHGIGMLAQAQSEFKDALKHDPDSRLAVQRLEEVEKLLAGTGAADSEPQLIDGERPSAGVGRGRADAIGPANAGSKPPEATAVNAALEESLRRQLERLRPPVHNTRRLAFSTLLWWGGGFSSMDLPEKVKWATSLQFAAVVICVQLMILVQAVSHMPREVGGFWALFRDRRQVLALCVTIYATGMLYFLYKILRDVRLLELQGHVVQADRGRNWLVSLNIGTRRGVRGTEVFQIYKEEARGSGRGRLVGQMIITDVADDRCSGTYVPHLREVPAPGDFAIALATVRARLVDPEEPSGMRFPRLPSVH